MATVRNQLIEALQNERLVQLRLVSRPEPVFGVVLAVDQKFVLIKNISRQGMVNGLRIYRQTVIASVVTHGDLLKSIGAMRDLAMGQHYFDHWNVGRLADAYDFSKHSILKTVLRTAFKADQVFTIGLAQGQRTVQFTGFLAELKQNHLNLNQVQINHLQARNQRRVAYADIDLVEIFSFDTYGATAVLERFMPGDFH